MKKILIVSGSRDRNGKTAKVCDSFAESLLEYETDVEKLFLPELKIEHCRQCENNGWGKCRREGLCIIEDEFSTIINKIHSSDGVVFATPVYYGDLSESLKSFLDRLRRTTTHETGKKKIEGKPVIGICVAGGGGGGSLNCSLALEKILTTAGFNILDILPVRRQNLELKLEVSKLIAKWFVKQI